MILFFFQIISQENHEVLTHLEYKEETATEIWRGSLLPESGRY